MDIMALAGMLFVLIILAMIGGFILLLPITQRLGKLLELRLQNGKADAGAKADLRQMEAALRAMQEELAQVAERQSFTDSLLTHRARIQIPGESEKPPLGPSA